MLASAPSNKVSRGGLLWRYCSRLVALAERERADAATLLAHRQKAVADVARLDMLKATDAEKSDFGAHMLVAHMSHELRTPLNAIIGFSDMIRLRLKDESADAKLLGYVDDINGAGWHLLGVINDILDLSKIEAGRLELTEENVALAAAVDSCARMIKGQVDEKNIDLICDVPTTLPKLVADELKLKQILINLLSNAVKFTPDHGRIVVRAEMRASGVVISVADTGIGIDAQDLPKVFTPFTQLNATVSRKYKGTGLGLPLAKALVELHDGTVTIVSAVGKGTTVIIRLPARRIVRSPRAKPPEPGAQGADHASPAASAPDQAVDGEI